MKVTLEMKFIEFKASDPEVKKEIKALEKDGWTVDLISAKRAKTKKFRIKRLLDKAV